MKKITAILLSVLMLASVLCIGVSAAGTVNVSLTGAAQATKGETYTVTLSVDDKTVGGIQGTITYDSASFTFKGIEITEGMATANRVTATNSANLINSATAGTIKFAVLGDGNSTQLFKLKFETKTDATATTANFTLGDVVVSNGEGTATVTNTTVSIENKNIYASAIKVNGASVRTNGDSEIRFEVDVTYAGEDVSEVGIMMIPTWLAAGKELTLDGEYSYNGTNYNVSVGKLMKVQLGENTRFYGYFVNSSLNELRIRTAVSARAYVKLNDGTVIYSDNVVSENNISGGTSSRCCIDVLRGVAVGKTLADNIKAILEKENKQWTLEDYKDVVTALNRNTSLNN